MLWQGHQQVLVVIDESFIVMCRLHADLLVEDLADRLQISVSTHSRIFLAWINLLYVALESVSILPSRECVTNAICSPAYSLIPYQRQQCRQCAKYTANAQQWS